MAKILTTLLICFYLINAKAYNGNTSTYVEIPFYTNYLFNKAIFNSAYAGFERKSSVTLLGNFQHNGPDSRNRFEYYPNNSNYPRPSISSNFNNIQLSGQTAFTVKKSQLGISLLFNNHESKYESRQQFQLNEAMHIPLKEGYLSIGLGGTLFMNTFSGDRLNQTIDTPKFDKIYKNNFLTSQVGIAYINKDKHFYAGIGINNLYTKLPTTIYIKDQLLLNIYPATIFNISAGKIIKHNEKLQSHINAICMMYNGGPVVSADYAMQYNNQLKVGINYTSSELYGEKTGGASLGYTYKKIDINYGFNIYLSRIMSVLSGIHQVGINYRFN
ncbi:MAG: type IX secretion system membrane protein PorP/SprF [Bacteroidota bacterium]